jgi:catechol 2,3-dioxygenase-like lactoylglutathione lyase family enzyme
MIGYVTLGTDDVERARAFYDGLLGPIGATRLLQLGEDDGGFTLYGIDWTQPSLAILRPYDGAPQQPGNGNMVAFVMDQRAKVDAFRARALELGGTDEGAPGLRGDPAMNFYAAYVRDPEGHKLAAFCTALEA